MSRSSSADGGRPSQTLLRRLGQAAPALRFRPAGAAIVALLVAHVLGVLPLAPLTRLDHLLYDLHVRLFAPQGPDARVVMVDVDERSLAAQGRWPWRRAVLAELLARLVHDGGARLVGLDIVFAEPDHSSGLAALDELARGPLGSTPAFRQALDTLRPALDDDSHLAEALRRLPVVLAFHLSDEVGAARAGALPPALLPDAALGAHLAHLPDWRGHGGNLPQLQQAALYGAGHLNGQFDDDGVIRRMPLLLRHDGALHGALSLVMARQWLGMDAETAAAMPSPPPLPAALSLAPAEPPLRELRLAGSSGALRIPVDEQARALLPYRAGSAGFAHVSAADVLAGALAPQALHGKAVLVGVSAPGLIDQRATPVGGTLAGTLLHANMLAGMLDGRVIAEPDHAGRWQAALLLAMALLMAWALPRLRMAEASALAAALVALLLLMHALAWEGLQRTLPLGALVLLPPLLMALHLLLAYRHAIIARRRLKRLFGQYVPPELVHEMSRQPERHTMNSRSAELSVLFADVRGFTGLAERMPPAELSAMMNLLFSRLTDTVRQHRGTLDKYIGDCVMAFWGAPLDDPDHARHAVDAALAMRAQLPALQDELARHGWPRLDLSIGVDSGTVVVGDMGSRHRLAYTVLGDAVNRAARLQALAGSAELGLVIGEATRRGQGDRLCLPLGEVALKGRDAALGAWLPLPWAAGERPEADARAAAWQRLRLAESAGNRAEAKRLLAALETTQPADPLCTWQRHRWAEAGTAG